MRIAALGDTHDNLPAIRKVVDLLNSYNPDLVMHTGDYVSDLAAQEFGLLKAKMIGVFGESDGDRASLKRAFAKVNAEIRGEFYVMNYQGTKIALLHGPQTNIRELAHTQCFDLIIYGHTHNVKQRREKSTTIVNPGEVCGYLSGKRTCAIIDLPELEITIREF